MHQTVLRVHLQKLPVRAAEPQQTRIRQLALPNPLQGLPLEGLFRVTHLHLRHKVGRCPICGAPILDCGYCDDPELWEHAWTPMNGQ